MELAANFSLLDKGGRVEDDYQKLVHLLRDWAAWMDGYNPNIGFRSRVPMLATGGISTTFEDMLDQIDNHAMKAIDASIESLPPSNRAAINRCYGVCAVFRFPRASYPYEVALSDAHDLLMVTLKRKGVIV